MANVGFYVSSIDGPSKCLMLGPFNTHAAALARVDECLKACDKVDPRAWFRAWGTCRLETENTLPLGRANTLMSFTPSN